MRLRWTFNRVASEGSGIGVRTHEHIPLMLGIVGLLAGYFVEHMRAALAYEKWLGIVMWLGALPNCVTASSYKTDNIPARTLSNT